jgi:5-formyltetrahydrofolate cyclo-ligase
LEVGAYNILEPRQDTIKEIPIESIDLILVPGVVFDIHGNRIGHGKGYYDRLLNDTQNIPHVGLAFGFQIVDAVPVEGHDLPVDIIVTEERIIECKF